MLLYRLAWVRILGPADIHMLKFFYRWIFLVVHNGKKYKHKYSQPLTKGLVKHADTTLKQNLDENCFNRTALSRRGNRAWPGTDRFELRSPSSDPGRPRFEGCSHQVGWKKIKNRMTRSPVWLF